MSKLSQKLEQRLAVQHAIGRFAESTYREPELLLMGWGVEQGSPPQYALDIYDAYQMSTIQIKALADALYGLAQEAYLEGINTQLTMFGLPVMGRVSDRQVLARLRAGVDASAQSVADTYHRKLANRVYSQWSGLPVRAAEGDGEGDPEAIDEPAPIEEQAPDVLDAQVAAWADVYAADKAAQVANYETAAYFNQGATDFHANNPGAAQTFHVEPEADTNTCAECMALLELGSVSAEDIVGVDFPIHVQCDHAWVPDPAEDWNPNPDDVWAAQGDAEAGDVAAAEPQRLGGEAAWRVYEAWWKKRELLEFGGPGSGDHGHAGRPGELGGSAPGGGAQRALHVGDRVRTQHGLGTKLGGRISHHPLVGERLRVRQDDGRLRLIRPADIRPAGPSAGLAPLAPLAGTNESVPSGPIAAEIMRGIRDRAATFFAAGGRLVEVGGEAIVGGRAKLRELNVKAGEKLSQFNAHDPHNETSPRHRKGLDYLANAIANAATGSERAVIALNPQGEPVAAVSFSGQRALHVGVAGSSFEMKGAATAAELEVGRIAGRKGGGVKSMYLNDAKGFHLKMGRQLGVANGSSWTPAMTQQLLALQVPQFAYAQLAESELEFEPNDSDELATFFADLRARGLMAEPSLEFGGAGSGDFGHAGRPGQLGGSAGGGGERAAQARAYAQRTAQGPHVHGQSSFVDPSTGDYMTLTRAGTFGEQIFKGPISTRLAEIYGAPMHFVSGSDNEAHSNAFPIDARADSKTGIEIKTYNADEVNGIRTRIPTKYLSSKRDYLRSVGLQGAIVIQVVNQRTGQVTVYHHQGGEMGMENFSVPAGAELLGTWDMFTGRQIKAAEDFAEWLTRNFGGPGSGDYGHAGRQGELGGSAPGSGGPPIGERVIAPRTPALSAASGKRSWAGMPFDQREGEGPKASDTPPERTSSGDFVFYHGTSLGRAEQIIASGSLRHDDFHRVGLGTTPAAVASYAAMSAIKDGTPHDSARLRLVVDQDWVSQQNVGHEIGGSGHDQFLFGPSHELVGAAYQEAEKNYAIPAAAIKSIGLYDVETAAPTAFVGRSDYQSPVPGYSERYPALNQLWQLEFGGPGSGDRGHAGRPGERGGSAPGGGSSTPVSPHTTINFPSPQTPASLAAAQARFRELKGQWARINNELLTYVDEPNSSAAQAALADLKAVCMEMNHLQADPGGPRGIGLPGGPRDILIIGAGPGGLAAAINAKADWGADVLVVDSDVHPGGQAAHSSRIENFPGFPIGVTGEKLAQTMYEQTTRLGAETKFGVRAVGISYDPSTDLKTVTLSTGEEIQTRSVILAGGVEMRHLDFAGSDSPNVIYGDGQALVERGQGGHLVVIGGSNGAAQAALGAARQGSQVTVLARTDLSGMSDYQVEALRSNPHISIVEHDQIARFESTGVMTQKGQWLPDVKAVGVFAGGLPASDWLPDGISRSGSAVNVDGNLVTSMPGVYAVGDIRTHSPHRILGAASDGLIAERNIFQYLDQRAQAAPLAAAEASNVMDAIIEALFRLDLAHPYFPQLTETAAEPLDFGGTGSGDFGHAGRKGELGGSAPGSSASVKPSTLARMAQVEAKIHDVGPGIDTQQRFEHNPAAPGKYTAEREALHEQIIDRLLERASGLPREHQALITGGLPGAGKTSSLTGPLASELGIEHQGSQISNYMEVNADLIQEQMIELGMAPRVADLAPLEVAPLLHEEAADISRSLLERAAGQGLNVIVDLTMSSERSVDARIGLLHGQGYTVKGVFVDVPIAQSKLAVAQRYERGAEQWAQGRGYGGRYVPPSIQEGFRDGSQYNSRNAEVFDHLKSSFDTWAQIDNTGFQQRLVNLGQRLAATELLNLAEADQSQITTQIAAYRAGELSLEQLVASLVETTYPAPARMQSQPADAYARQVFYEAEPDYQAGSWDEIRRARNLGQLTAAEYAQISTAFDQRHSRALDFSSEASRKAWQARSRRGESSALHYHVQVDVDSGQASLLAHSHRNFGPPHSHKDDANISLSSPSLAERGLAEAALRLFQNRVAAAESEDLSTPDVVWQAVDELDAMLEFGGPGSGFRGHLGRPGERGGSAPGGGRQDKRGNSLRVGDIVRHQVLGRVKILGLRNKMMQVMPEAGGVRKQVFQHAVRRLEPAPGARAGGGPANPGARLRGVIDGNGLRVPPGEADVLRNLGLRRAGAAAPGVRPPTSADMAALGGKNWLSGPWPPTAQVVPGGEKALPGGHINKAYKLTFADGSKGVYKPAGEEYHGVDHGQWKNEVGASRIDEMLKLGVVPPTEAYVGARGNGALLRWTEGYVMGQPGFKGTADYERGDREAMAVLDYLTQNPDRHGGNYITGVNGHVVGNDNGLGIHNKLGIGNMVGNSRQNVFAATLEVGDHITLSAELMGRIAAADSTGLVEQLKTIGIDRQKAENVGLRLKELQSTGPDVMTVRSWITAHPDGRNWQGAAQRAEAEAQRVAAEAAAAAAEAARVAQVEAAAVAQSVQERANPEMRRAGAAGMAHAHGTGYPGRHNPAEIAAHMVAKHGLPPARARRWAARGTDVVDHHQQAHLVGPPGGF